VFYQVYCLAVYVCYTWILSSAWRPNRQQHVYPFSPILKQKKTGNCVIWKYGLRKSGQGECCCCCIILFPAAYWLQHCIASTFGTPYRYEQYTELLADSSSGISTGMLQLAVAVSCTAYTHGHLLSVLHSFTPRSENRSTNLFHHARIDCSAAHCHFSFMCAL